jgi:hypothetical protein
MCVLTSTSSVSSGHKKLVVVLLESHSYGSEREREKEPEIWLASTGFMLIVRSNSLWWCDDAATATAAPTLDVRSPEHLHPLVIRVIS